jgi:hypothetical protein
MLNVVCVNVAHWFARHPIVGDVVCEEAAGGRADLAVSRVVGAAGEARLASEEAKDGVIRVPV